MWFVVILLPRLSPSADVLVREDASGNLLLVGEITLLHTLQPFPMFPYEFGIAGIPSGPAFDRPAVFSDFERTVADSTEKIFSSHPHDPIAAKRTGAPGFLELFLADEETCTLVRHPKIPLVCYYIARESRPKIKGCLYRDPEERRKGEECLRRSAYSVPHSIEIDEDARPSFDALQGTVKGKSAVEETLYACMDPQEVYRSRHDDGIGRGKLLNEKGDVVPNVTGPIIDASVTTAARFDVE
jgi:hypothetical protein